MLNLTKTSLKKIVIFASGSGTNAENIIKYFKDSGIARVEAVFSNKKNAPVIEKAENLNVKTYTFGREEFYRSDVVFEALQEIKPDLIVLAGFLWIIPEKIIRKYSRKIINIHPALLPKFGGKGMYGMNVHRSVKEKGEIETGISVHYVNEKYDEGKIFFQEKVPVEPTDSVERIAEKIHILEQRHFPEVIEKILKDE